MDLFSGIGNTPLIDLTNLSRRRDITLYGKAEYRNPGGSVKDRAAAAMLADAIARGAVDGKTILEATSGNTGISYAMLGARLGIPVRLYLPANASIERKRILRCFGAEVIETSPLEGMSGAYQGACRAYHRWLQRYFYPEQYSNPRNWQIHYETTGPELLAQSRGALTHFVAGAGTGGTFTGCVRYLKEQLPSCTAILTSPDCPFHGIEGILHPDTHPIAGFFDAGLADEIAVVTTEESYQMVRTLARRQGILVGISAGANVQAALRVAETTPPGAVIVTILCDSGNRYLHHPVWEGLDDSIE